MSYPAGIINIPKDGWINYDEVGVFVERTKYKEGNIYIVVFLWEERPYNYSKSVHLLLISPVMLTASTGTRKRPVQQLMIVMRSLSDY